MTEPPPSPVKTVGFLGLGHAGFPLASLLPPAGFRVVVRDADRDKEREFVKANPGCAVAKPGPEGFGEVDVLITMLPNGDVVRDVLLGKEVEGTIIIDTSSSHPSSTISLSRALSTQYPDLHLHLLDSPLTQSKLGDVPHGNATLMVGCSSTPTTSSSAILSRVMPLLHALAKYVFHLGPLGSGHLMKTLNNYISAASIVALSDSLVLGAKYGLDPMVMLDVLNVGTGRNFSSAESFRTEGLTRRYASGFGEALLRKDVRIARGVFLEGVRGWDGDGDGDGDGEEERKGQGNGRGGFETALPDLILKEFERASVDGGLDEGADHTELLKGWERRAGVRLREGSADGKSAFVRGENAVNGSGGGGSEG